MPTENERKYKSKIINQGRYLAPSVPHIDCNDEGAEFLEASIDIPLHDFILKRDLDETINKLIPNGLGCAVNKTSPIMLEVQLNHFPCGGAAVAVSILHKAGDGFAMANFVNHWATVTRGGSPINPSFISSTIKYTDNLLDFSGINATLSKGKYVERRFVFPNSKLSELKNKINAMGVTPLNPTRVEALSSLLFKCAVDTATTKSGSLQLSNLALAVNMREKISTICPKSAAGNIFTIAIAMMADSDEIQLNEVITSLRKDRLEIKGLRDVEELGEMFINKKSTLAQDQSHRTYKFSSVCRFPFYQVDFGWGKPERVIVVTTGFEGSSHFVFMDTASGDGIEVIVHLEEGEMALLQNHKELLVYVEDNGKFMLN